MIKNQASNDSRIMKQIQTFVKFVTHLASDGATGGSGGVRTPPPPNTWLRHCILLSHTAMQVGLQLHN